MSPWFDLLLVALALGAGWVGWVLSRLAQDTSRLRRQVFGRTNPAPRPSISVAKAQAVDSEL